MALHSDNRNLIYWADDDLEDMETFEQLLLDIAPDYDIVNFQNGQLLVSHLEVLKPADYPNLIVLDMHMPVMNGIETLMLLNRKMKYNAIPKVMFTTSNNYEEKAFCESMNAKMFTKPFTLPALNHSLRTILSYASIAI